MPHARVEVVVAPKPAGAGATVLTVTGAPCGVGPDGADDIELRLLRPPGRAVAAAAEGRLRRRAVPGDARDRGRLRRRRRAAHARLRRGRRRGRRPGRGGDRPAAGPAGPRPPGAGGHPPAAGGRVRRPASRGRQGHRRRGDDQRGARRCEDTDRARELARMLAGLPDSDLGIAHAEELLSVASREKSYH